MGRLTFRRIDFGGQLNLSLDMRNFLGTGAEARRAQRANLGPPSAYEWVKQGGPNLPPGKKRIHFVAQSQRSVEMAADMEA